MKLMSDMFGTQNVQWSTNLDKVEISVDTSVATVDPSTLLCTMSMVVLIYIYVAENLDIV